MKKLIFLDIDGVLNISEKVYSTIREVEPELVQRFNMMINDHDYYFVLSSIWKNLENYGFGPTIETLRDIGLDTSRYIGSTPTTKLYNVARGDEIYEWLRDYDDIIESYVIVDNNDISDNLRHRFIKIDDKVGLTEEDVETIVNLMEG